MSGVVALVTAILLVQPAWGARLLQVYVERDGIVVAHSYYEDDGRADAASVWHYLQHPPIMVDNGVAGIEADAEQRLEAHLEGDLLLRIQHVERIIAQARLSTLTLCREHEQSRAWFLPVAEVERTAAAAGLGPPAKRLTSVALRYGLAAILAVALLFAVGLTAKALLFPRQLKGQHNG